MVTAPALREGMSASQLTERMHYLGGTDVAAILGLSPYMTPLQVYRNKKGLAVHREVNEAMQHGINLEPYVAALYRKHTGKKLRKSHFYRHKQIPFFGVNPDYEVQGERGLVECKTASFYMGSHFGEAGTDDVPDYYLIQCQWEMFITGREACDLAVLIGGNRFQIHPIPRHEKLIESIASRAHEWWETFILSDCPPPLTGDEADSQWLKTAYPQDNGQTITATEEQEHLIVLLEAAWRAEKQAERRLDEITNQLKASMQEARVLQSSAGKFSWATFTKHQTDWKTLAKAQGIPQSVIDQHTEHTPVRQFRTPFKEER